MPAAALAERPPRPVLLAGLLACSLAVAGCSSIRADDSDDRSGAATTRGLAAAAIAALADRRPPSELPPATVTVGEAAAALAATQPPAGPVGALDAAAAAEGMRFAAGLVAATRADRDYLCGPRAADPAAALSTAATRAFLGDPANADSRTSIEATIGSAAGRDDCGPLTWVGPGVVLGPQTWQLAAGRDGTDATVTWTGTMSYALADATGAPEPWSLDASAEYGLARTADGRWLLDTWNGARGVLTQGWRHDVPLPAGYLPEPDVPAGDPDALKAVQSAAAAWQVAPASDIEVEASTDDPNATGSDGEASSGFTATVAAAPARGDATAATDSAGDRTRQILTGGGRTALLEADGPLKAKPGRTLPARVEWTRTDTTTPGDGGVSFGVSPFEFAALLAATGAAAPANCAPDSSATTAACYTAVVATAQDVPLARDYTSLPYRAGNPFLVADVGLDEQGRLAEVRIRQRTRAFGEDYSVLEGRVRFTAYPTSPPPPVELPDPAVVADRRDVQF